MRRFGHPPLSEVHYTPRPGVYAIIIRNRKILLTEQAEPEVEIQLPGGGIDPGEHPLPALHREAYEETGWKISPICHLNSYRRFTYMPEYNLHAMKVAHIFLCHAVRRLGAPTEPLHKPVWADLNDAPHLLGPEGDAHIVADYITRLRG